MSQGMPSSLARMLAVPAGSSAIGTWLPGQPVDHFVDGAVAAAGDHHAAPLLHGLPRDRLGGARPGRGSQLRGDARILQQAARRARSPRNGDAAALRWSGCRSTARL